ncbi:putative ATPase [Malassezia pachydermatis]
MGEKLLRRQQEDRPAKRARTTEAPASLADLAHREQPALVTGATLKPYQMDGLVWLTSLYENGLNGILADEMGLGKTLQTIAFLAHLYEKGIHGPFLIVAPLSTTFNWQDEFTKFAPTIPTLLYHGAKAERLSLQKKFRSKSSTTTLSVVITSYEMILKDRAFLGKQAWKFVVVDEGHRLKNLHSRLLRELKQFRTSNRLILTGTPLHNNLAELWSLLNFILPDIFDDLATFEQWFNLGEANDDGSKSESVTTSFAKWSTDTACRVVQQLHDILKPFLLRRVKSEVERNLPPKQEYLLYTHLSTQQALMYNLVLDGSFRAWLTARKACLPLDYDTDSLSQTEKDALALATKEVQAMRLDNTLMQLRKICCHPYLFDWPVVAGTDQLQIDAQLVQQSGKMRMLDCLVSALITRGHRVLIFSQFSHMLNILEIWAQDLKQWNTFRIDGSTPQDRRAEQVRRFNDPDSDCHVFLLSTRASGLGINLVGADTVIFFDSDWNPQMDLQAQDRVHRIGQTNPVLVFRLVASDTIEQDILQKARAKRLLEAVVIQKGKFLRPITHARLKDTYDTNADLTTLIPALMKLEAETSGEDDQPPISDADLERLLDRSEKAYARTDGWISTDDASTKDPLQPVAVFEVSETQADSAQGKLASFFRNAENAGSDD